MATATLLTFFVCHYRNPLPATSLSKLVFRLYFSSLLPDVLSIIFIALFSSCSETKGTSSIFLTKPLAIFLPLASLFLIKNLNFDSREELDSKDLEKKEIKGAALDVFKNEPLEESGFYNLDNIILTPHIAASTDEAQIVVAEMVANQFVEFFNNNKIINSVT